MQKMLILQKKISILVHHALNALFFVGYRTPPPYVVENRRGWGCCVVLMLPILG